MNVSPRSLIACFVFAAAIGEAAEPPAGAPVPQSPGGAGAAATLVVRPADAASAAALPPPLRFDKMPLENVARVLSARYHVPIRIDANAAAPISGDFTFYGAARGIAEAARQAKLAAMPLGSQPWAGYHIGPLPAKAAPSGDALAKTEDTPDAAARQRTELADRRAKLLAELERLGH